MDKGQGKFREEIMFNKHVKIIKFTSNHRNSNQMGPLLFTHDQISEKWRRALVAGMGNECCHGRLTWVWVGTTSSRAIKSLCLYSLHPNDSICKYLFYRDPCPCSQRRMYKNVCCHNTCSKKTGHNLDIISRGIIQLWYVHTMEYYAGV